ncbi:hypothetical protein XENOCAPTIV_021817 [Xenoophorus captivus]|uniref:Uncharacterized protein n=1 Tax=Xenoophorus captivus TaxID=1517983 RepID=A0ABV0RJV8_9TELE
MCLSFVLIIDVDAAKALTQTPASNLFFYRTTGFSQTLGLQLFLNIQRNQGYFVQSYNQVPDGSPQYVLTFHHSDSSLDFRTSFSCDIFNSKATNIDYQFVV